MLYIQACVSLKVERKSLLGHLCTNFIQQLSSLSAFAAGIGGYCCVKCSGSSFNEETASTTQEICYRCFTGFHQLCPVQRRRRKLHFWEKHQIEVKPGETILSTKSLGGVGGERSSVFVIAALH